MQVIFGNDRVILTFVMKKSICTLKIPKSQMRSECPITNTLDLIGDKWTLLVIRDLLFLQKKLFHEFLESREKIATNILTERLKRLEECGIIEKHAYTKKPLRFEYILTKRGKTLKPLLLEFVKWGNTHIEGTFVPPKDLFRQKRKRKTVR